jgi:hypothetical protein
MEKPPMRRSLPPLNALRSFDAAARGDFLSRTQFRNLYVKNTSVTGVARRRRT